MTFEEALRKMKDGYEVGLEHPTDTKIYKIIDGEICRWLGDSKGWISLFFDSDEILSNDWYVRR